MKKVIVSSLIGMVALASYQAQAAAPPNDNFADAVALPGDNGNLADNNNIDATFQTGEPTCFYTETTNTVWFKWTCTNAGAWTISTIGSLDQAQRSEQTATPKKAFSQILWSQMVTKELI